MNQRCQPGGPERSAGSDTSPGAERPDPNPPARSPAAALRGAAWPGGPRPPRGLPVALRRGGGGWGRGGAAVPSSSSPPRGIQAARNSPKSSMVPPCPVRRRRPPQRLATFPARPRARPRAARAPAPPLRAAPARRCPLSVVPGTAKPAPGPGTGGSASRPPAAFPSSGKAPEKCPGKRAGFRPRGKACPAAGSRPETPRASEAAGARPGTQPKTLSSSLEGHGPPGGLRCSRARLGWGAAPREEPCALRLRAPQKPTNRATFLSPLTIYPIRVKAWASETFPEQLSTSCWCHKGKPPTTSPLLCLKTVTALM